jgi:glutamyl-tRNA reductase
MLSQFKYIGASYHKADLSLRESISLNDQECKELVLSVKEMFGCTEFLAISTCNRTGFYYNHHKDLSKELIQLLGIKKGVFNLLERASSFLVIDDHQEAILHLFRVSMGLDSQVIGDLQIANQFKKSYQISADADMCGTFIHRIMHSIFFTNKRVAQETNYRDGTASVSYAATELILDFSANFKDPKVLILGLGEMGVDVAKNLKTESNLAVSICNRTEELAQEWGKELGFNVLSFKDFETNLKDFDIVLTAATVSSPIINASHLGGARIGLKYFIDLGLPRCIDVDVANLPGTLVYNIDNIRNQTEETIKKRLASVPKVEEIIAESISDFASWELEMEVSPTINKLKTALEEIRKEEIAKYMKSIDASNQEVIDTITKGMMQKIMKLPVMQLKAACKRGEAETLIDVLNDLFNLDTVKESK